MGKSRPNRWNPNRAWNHFYARYKRRAHRRKIKFGLSLEQFKEISTKDCHYCGGEPQEVKTVADRYMSNGGKCPFRIRDLIVRFNGIDRTDSSGGYTLDNCVPCCHMCNWMKNKFEVDAFIEQAKKIASKWGSE